MRFHSEQQRKAMFARLNPYRHSSMGQLRKAGVNLRAGKDSDNDGLANRWDSEPLNHGKPSPKEAAEIIFDKTKKLDKAEKVEDLMEDSPKVLKPTRSNVKQWSRNIQGSDIAGVDTQDLHKAQDLTSSTAYDKEDRRAAQDYLKERNIKADLQTQHVVAEMIHEGDDPDSVDLRSYQSKDKALREALQDMKGEDL